MAASREARDQWKRFIDQYIATFTELQSVSTRFGMRGNAKLSRALQWLKARSDSLPMSIQEADAIQKQMSEARQAMNQLKIEGKPGEFLKKAAAGKGNPLDLFDQEVKRFLDERQLWGLLRVTVQ